MSRCQIWGFAAAMLLTAQAAAATPPTPVLRQDLPNAPGLRMTAIKVSYAPEEVPAPHRHASSAFIMAYVLCGAVVSQVEGESLRTDHAGEHWTEGPGAHHIVGRNASLTEPAEVLIVFVAPGDATLTTKDQ